MVATQVPTPIAKWKANGDPGAAICMMYVKHSTGNQACMGLTTIAKQPGQENGGHPFTTTHILALMHALTHAWLHSPVSLQSAILKKNHQISKFSKPKCVSEHSEQLKFLPTHPHVTCIRSCPFTPLAPEPPDETFTTLIFLTFGGFALLLMGIIPCAKEFSSHERVCGGCEKIWDCH